jgi:hypothetical protein
LADCLIIIIAAHGDPQGIGVKSRTSPIFPLKNPPSWWGLGVTTRLAGRNVASMELEARRDSRPVWVQCRFGESDPLRWRERWNRALRRNEKQRPVFLPQPHFSAPLLIE